MFRSKFLKFIYIYLFILIFIFNAVGISLAVRPKPPTRLDVIDLVESYPKVMELSLNDGHGYYKYSYLNQKANRPPLMSSTESLPGDGGGVRASDKKVIDMVFWYFNDGRYIEASYVVYNVLESVCYTYMYRFCRYAVEMNMRGKDLTQNLANFYELMHAVRGTLIEIDYQTTYIDFLMNIYKNFDAKHRENGYTKSDEDYKSHLLDLMNMVEYKINFAQLGTYDQQYALQKWPLKKLENVQQKEISNAINLLQRIPVETDTETGIETGAETGTDIEGSGNVKDVHSCMICLEKFNPNEEILGFVPCGHIISCHGCISQLTTCPLCRHLVRLVEVIVVKPSSLHGYDYWDRIPRNAIDQEARCLSCTGKIPLEKKMIVLPCGHGLYCQKCTGLQNCSVCKKKIKNTMFIYG